MIILGNNPIIEKIIGQDENNIKTEDKIQDEIDKLNQEFQEDSDYQEIKPEEIYSEIGEEDQESNKEHSDNFMNIWSNPLPITIEETPNNFSNFILIIDLDQEIKNEHKDKILTISEENELINETENSQNKPKRITRGNLSPKSYTNIQTDTQLNFYKGKKTK